MPRLQWVEQVVIAQRDQRHAQLGRKVRQRARAQVGGKDLARRPGEQRGEAADELRVCGRRHLRYGTHR